MGGSQKAPAITQKKSAEEKGWDKLGESERRGGADETGELKTHRDATGRALRSRPIHPSSRTYVRTYIRAAYLSDNAYRLIERDVLRRDGRLLVVPLD